MYHDDFLPQRGTRRRDDKTDRHWPLLVFLELYLRRDLDHNIRSLLPKLLFWKDKEWLAVATAATVPRPFCCQKFSKKACAMLGDEELGRVYHADFFAWYAQRVRFLSRLYNDVDSIYR